VLQLEIPLLASHRAAQPLGADPGPDPG